ncbi:hypothetical protein LUTEI9C_150100 [Luteimonas sp. 9C]|nr:hypothetical protein LUTEI9C_150100 [Luteimonas sp. 9C]
MSMPRSSTVACLPTWTRCRCTSAARMRWRMRSNPHSSRAACRRTGSTRNGSISYERTRRRDPMMHRDLRRAGALAASVLILIALAAAWLR